VLRERRVIAHHVEMAMQTRDAVDAVPLEARPRREAAVAAALEVQEMHLH
jgi:hypothetical protein